MLPARHGPTVQEIDDRASCIVWPAARVLLQWLRASLRESLGTELAGATVLELGAGTGFLALALAEAGAGKVFAVEGDEDAWENLKQNVRASAKVQPVFWNWETDPSMPQEVPLQSVQLVVASDVVYPRYYDERALAQLIQGLLGTMSEAWRPPVVLLLCDREMPADGSPSADRSLDSFLSVCDELDLGLCELPLAAELVEEALGHADGHGCHEDPGGALGSLTHMRLVHFRVLEEKGDQGSGLPSQIA